MNQNNSNSHIVDKKRISIAVKGLYSELKIISQIKLA